MTSLSQKFASALAAALIMLASFGAVVNVPQAHAAAHAGLATPVLA